MTAPATFEQIFQDVCAMLSNGVIDRTTAAHTPVVGTGDGDLRIMVLRHFDPTKATLRFHTDARAPKCETITHDSSVHVLIYDRDRKVQLRLSGQGAIHRQGALADSAWNESTAFARRCYLGAAPGTVSTIPTSGLPSEVEGVAPTENQLVDARNNFALLVVKLNKIDWFFLDHHGHKRAIIDLADRTRDRWVAP